MSDNGASPVDNGSMPAPDAGASANGTAGGSPASPPLDPAYAAESNTIPLMAVVTIFQLLSLIFVVLRMYVRMFIVKSTGRDDITMLFALLFTLGGGYIPFVFMSQHGLGKHILTVSFPDLLVYFQANFWMSIFAMLIGLGLVKISIGFNLLRLSTSRWYTWSLWVTLVFVVAYTFMACMTFFLHCDTVAGNWDLTGTAKCYSLDLFITFAVVNTSFNIFTDVLFAVFPIPIIWTLQMKKKTRIYLVVILSLGYFAVAMGIVKGYYQLTFASDTDSTWGSNVQLWGFLQINVAIIAACATSLKPLFTRLLGLSSTKQYNTPASYGYGRSTRGTKLKDGTILKSKNGGGTSVTVTQVDEFELEAQNEKGMARAKRTSIPPGAATSFYKHSPPDGSGSEEMILGHGMSASPPSVAVGGFQAEVDRAYHPANLNVGRGIVRTTEVQVVYK
ncbi:hypothetical protein QBC47DRAFT_350497 [Echria macrotheca]|uniref:Rhodopsin domain-containing protein n=1 Tax=Echria macrotheca TaxID=438768 RepID=A0AAJ0F2G7_9PEZI|nr:hypothetical protein QBC47DRAFT_350497 [Echria macrotheca]